VSVDRGAKQGARPDRMFPAEGGYRFVGSESQALLVQEVRARP
jgi:hypothetical protein